MKLRYENSLEDLVAVGVKALARSPNLRRTRQRGLSAAAVCAWIIGYSSWAGPFFQRVAIAFGLAGVGFAIYWFSDSTLLRRKLRKLYLGKLAGRFPLQMEVEISRDGLEYSQGADRLEKSWAGLEKIRESKTAVDLFFSDGSLISLPEKAFASQAERAEIRKAISEYRR